MKQIDLTALAIFLFLSFAISSCEAISGIFNAGMSFGMAIVVFVIVVMGVLFMRSNRK